MSDFPTFPLPSPSPQPQIEELSKDVDLDIYDYLEHEGTLSEAGLKAKQTRNDVKSLEQQLSIFKQQEAMFIRLIGEYTAKREQKSREATKQKERLVEVETQKHVLNSKIKKLKKVEKENTARYKEYQQMSDRFKKERNRKATEIQATIAEGAETKEKIKILQNEKDILLKEILERDAQLSMDQIKHQEELKQKNRYENEKNRLHYQLKQRQEHIDQQLTEIDKLNSVINLMEEEMLKLKRSYESKIEERNMTGLQLIDRNDELCILYEKSNIQEEYLKEGELALQEREEEMRRLKNDLRELRRQSQFALEKKIPVNEEFSEQKDMLEEMLMAERTKVMKLSELLQNPKTKERWRDLGGSDPDPKQLDTRIRALEERLNEKKEQLLEKNLVLEEITSLSNRLRAETESTREDTLELANKINDFQNRIKVTTRKMMATVSELSLYQAKAMELQQENNELEDTLVMAKKRWEHNEPPTDEMEAEYYRKERERLRAKEERLKRQHQQAEEEELAFTVQTTANPRPNAYISEETGLPKPYGSAQPFFPSTTGAQIRHFRKPVVQEVEI
eukprot:TRINITY_DN1577_c0_g1_i5.p1 TRINITY_DN1577_c0_g1~~TRINITY_DN1577_c0_g1_i5.p1  ORF type:complete len:583 (-),score=235.71 TRINITY_DN1577_c0_g1_i5:138-1829(-)